MSGVGGGRRRISKGFGSEDANALMELAEDPERMVKQIIRELDAEVRAARAAVVRAIAAEKQLAAELARTGVDFTVTSTIVTVSSFDATQISLPTWSVSGPL